MIRIEINIKVMRFVFIFNGMFNEDGVKAKFRHRWISFFGFTFQPSELAKVAVIMLFAWWLARNQRRIDEFKRGALIPFGMLGCFALAIIVEPDFGTTLLVSSVAIGMMFLAGVGLSRGCASRFRLGRARSGGRERLAATRTGARRVPHRQCVRSPRLAQTRDRTRIDGGRPEAAVRPRWPLGGARGARRQSRGSKDV